MFKIAILGYGTIGSGVYEYIRDNNKQLSETIGTDIKVSKILELRDLSKTEVKDLVVSDFSLIENDEEIDLVVECMGGLKPAYDFVKRSLLKSKHVVTSNKAIVAQYGTELIKIAKEKNVNFMFEASVGGGIPIIRNLNNSLAGEHIEEISGILNGTTNFILTKMDKESLAYEDVLKQAQDLGYAEANPDADVLGQDACRKIAILSSLASKKEVNFEQIYTEGITEIDTKDFLYAKKLNMSLKLVASASFKDESLATCVCPRLVSANNPLYFVSDVFNAVFIKGNKLGDCMLYGSGAGKFPTASAVVADIIEIAKNSKVYNSPNWTCEKLIPESILDMEFKYLIRIADNIDNKNNYLALFGNFEVVSLDEEDKEFAIITDTMLESTLIERIIDEEKVIKFIRFI